VSPGRTGLSADDDTGAAASGSPPLIFTFFLSALASCLEPEEIVFVIGQQNAPSRCSGENLWSHHFLAEIVREKAPGGLSFDERHLLVDARKRVWLEIHQVATFSRRFFLKRSPCIAFSTSLTRAGI
jgi:hypothetical protein